MLCYNKKTGEHTLAVLSAAKKLDWKKLRKRLGKKTSMATETDVNSITGCVLGAVPPFGSLFLKVSHLVAHQLATQQLFLLACNTF